MSLGFSNDGAHILVHIPKKLISIARQYTNENYEYDSINFLNNHINLEDPHTYDIEYLNISQYFRYLINSWICLITNFPFKDVKIFWWVATSSKSVIYTFAAHPSFHDILHLNQKQQCLLCYSFLLCCVYNFPIILHLSFQCTNVVQA